MKYDITKFIDMKTYFRRVNLKRKDTFKIIRELLNVILESNNYYLDWENFIYESDKIFLNLDNFDVKLIYVPLKDTTDIKWTFKEFFMNDFLSSVKFDESENFSFIISIINLMNLYEGTDEKIIFRKIIDLINKEESDKIVVEKALVEEKVVEKKITNLSNGFLEILKKRLKVNLHSNKNTEKAEKKEEYSSTVILKSIKKGYFFVSKSEEYENIAIKDYNILIGRSKNNVDAFIDNISVGKIHAEVINDDGQYYIKDMNSLNGTFINDKKISSFKMEEINVGDVVRFADAEYIFDLR